MPPLTSPTPSAPSWALAEQLGRFFVGLHDGLPDALDIEYEGELAGVSTGILTLSALKGIFGGSTEEPVSYVNAPQLAAQRGSTVRESSTSTSPDYKSLDHAAVAVARGVGHAHHCRACIPTRVS